MLGRPCLLHPCLHLGIAMCMWGGRWGESKNVMSNSWESSTSSSSSQGLLRRLGEVCEKCSGPHTYTQSLWKGQNCRPPHILLGDSNLEKVSFSLTIVSKRLGWCVFWMMMMMMIIIGITWFEWQFSAFVKTTFKQEKKVWLVCKLIGCGKLNRKDTVWFTSSNSTLSPSGCMFHY